MQPSKTIDEYLGNFPFETRVLLEEIRKLIKKIVPEAGEKISYGVPTFTLNGKYFIYMAGYKNHISIYPVTKAMQENIKEIPKYRTGKGTLQFPLNKPIPMDIIEKIIRVRYKESKKNKS